MAQTSSIVGDIVAGLVVFVIGAISYLIIGRGKRVGSGVDSRANGVGVQLKSNSGAIKKVTDALAILRRARDRDSGGNNKHSGTFP